MTRKKGGPKEPTLPKDKQDKLKDLFLRGGITPFKASQIVKCHHKTAKTFFEKFAVELCNDERHEDWFSREKRVRQQALEGYANDIEKIREDITEYRKILEDKLKEDDDDGIDQYERIVRLNSQILNDKLDTFNAIQMEPPTEILLEQEIQRRLDAKSGTKDTEE